MWREFVRYLAFRKLSAVLFENVLLVCCVLNAGQIRLGSSFTESAEFPSFVAKAFLIALVFQLNLHFRDVYDFRSTDSFPHFVSRLAQALLMASGVLTFLYYFFPELLVGRGVFVISLILVSVFLTVWHTLLRLYFGVRAPKSRVLVLGTGRLARELVKEVLHSE